jgi:mono/diheme cytochrome c family protein
MGALEDGFMTRYPLALLLLLTAAPAVLAQQPADGLTDQQRMGRQVLSQSCGVCHLPPVRNAKPYGPALHKGSAMGDDALMRKIITEGTPRMPAFKYFLQPDQIDAIVAYVRTLSTTPPAPAAGASR